jgi:hypothetical protein
MRTPHDEITEQFRSLEFILWIVTLDKVGDELLCAFGAKIT